MSSSASNHIYGFKPEMWRGAYHLPVVGVNLFEAFSLYGVSQ
jgi:hypothetical protein